MQLKANTTPPRRVDVMNGPIYRPSATPCRAGALDFAAFPSIHGGRAVPFKTRLEVNHG